MSPNVVLELRRLFLGVLSIIFLHSSCFSIFSPFYFLIIYYNLNCIIDVLLFHLSCCCAFTFTLFIVIIIKLQQRLKLFML